MVLVIELHINLLKYYNSYNTIYENKNYLTLIYILVYIVEENHSIIF